MTKITVILTTFSDGSKTQALVVGNTTLKITGKQAKLLIIGNDLKQTSEKKLESGTTSLFYN